MSQSNRQTERDEPAAASGTRRSWKSMLALWAGAIPVGVILSLAVGSKPREMLDIFLFWMVVASIGVLGARFKIVLPTLERGYVLFRRFGDWITIALGPLIAFWLLSKLINLVNLPLELQVIAFLAWGFLLVVALVPITTESTRERLLSPLLQQGGRFAPFIYSLNVLFIAIMFFGSVTYVLVEHELVRFGGLAERADPAGALLDFYLWHFLEALPLLKVNETLHWEKPLTYDSVGVGLLLLVFKITVIVPVIAAFAWYWAHLGRNRTQDE